MSRTFFSCFFLFISISALSQSSGSLRLELKQIRKDSLRTFDITVSASRSLDTLINTAITEYSKSPAKESYDRIVDNFSRLIHEIKNEKMLKTGNVEGYLINKQSIQKAKFGICPLYPFCK